MKKQTPEDPSLNRNLTRARLLASKEQTEPLNAYASKTFEADVIVFSVSGGTVVEEFCIKAFLSLHTYLLPWTTLLVAILTAGTRCLGIEDFMPLSVPRSDHVDPSEPFVGRSCTIPACLRHALERRTDDRA